MKIFKGKLVPILFTLVSYSAFCFVDTNIANSFSLSQSFSHVIKRPIKDLKIANLIYHNNQSKKFNNFCDTNIDRDIKFLTNWKQAVATKTVIANLQYQGLLASMKKISYFSQKFEVTPVDFKKYVKKLVANSCSPNITVMSRKFIGQKLLYDFETKISDPYKSLSVLEPTHSQDFESIDHQKKLFFFAQENFRHLCSWGGDIDELRSLRPYLNNPLVMSAVNSYIKGEKLSVHLETNKIVRSKLSDHEPVLCRNLLCRPTTNIEFKTETPRLLGANSFDDDMKHFYCSFKDKKVTNKNGSNLSYLEKNFLALNLFSNFLDLPFVHLKSLSMNEVLEISESSMDYYWKNLSTNALSKNLQGFTFEESLKLRLKPMRVLEQIQRRAFAINFDVMAGEMDQELNQVDKIQMTMNLSLTKDYLIWLRNNYNHFSNKQDKAGLNEFMNKAAHHILTQANRHHKKLLLKLWNDKFEHIIVNELVQQVNYSIGTYFDDLRPDEVIKIPVKFHFGIFALGVIKDKFSYVYEKAALTFKKKSSF